MESTDDLPRSKWGSENSPPGSPSWVHFLLDKFDSEEPVSEEYFQLVLSHLNRHSPTSLQRIGEALDRKLPLDELDEAQRDLFDLACDFLPHPDKLAYYEAMRCEHEAMRRAGRSRS